MATRAAVGELATGAGRSLHPTHAATMIPQSSIADIVNNLLSYFIKI
jgi:hypothetical protein